VTNERTQTTRRDVLRSLARYSVMGGLVAAGAHLVIKPGRCAGTGLCEKCGLLNGCVLPQAANARADRSMRTNESAESNG
jgi:hypothetical protein